jgi:hypothetical protein
VSDIQEAAVEAAAKAIHDEFCGYTDCLTTRGTAYRDADKRAAVRIVDALEPFVVERVRVARVQALQEAEERIEKDGRAIVAFLAGDKTPDGIVRLVGAEDAYRDALRIVAELRAASQDGGTT